MGSNRVSNVPLVVVAVHWVQRFSDPTTEYLLLAVASTLAGSVGNLIVFEGAGPRGRVGFWRFFRYGAVLTATTLAAALSILWLEHAVF